MAVRMRITSDLADLKLDLLTEADMRAAGELAIRRIRTRTESGVDEFGAGFRAYSPGYAAQKRAALGHARVDLTVSGGMLNDMQVVAASKNTATISFISQGGGSTQGTFIQRSRSMGAMDKAIYNDPTRKFFGLSEDDQQVIVEALDQALTRRLAGEQE